MMRAEEQRNEINNISDALQMLDDAAQKSGHDIQQKIRSDIIHLKKP